MIEETINKTGISPKITTGIEIAPITTTSITTTGIITITTKDRKAGRSNLPSALYKLTLLKNLYSQKSNFKVDSNPMSLKLNMNLSESKKVSWGISKIKSLLLKNYGVRTSNST